jgi:hypothetical protein
MKIGCGWAVGAGLALLAGTGGAAGAQVQVRVGVPGRATYSELHEALRLGTPAADTVQRIQRLRSPSRLWRIAQTAIAGTGDWNAGLVALTRLAVLGRLGAGAADSLSARFLSAPGEEFKVRYLTLLSYFTDPALIPLLARVYAAPDSFGLPKRYAIRASDGLLWIGTRASLQALLDARAAARARGLYDDPDLRHADLDFLGSDSSSVISRTGKWLTEWIGELGGGRRSERRMSHPERSEGGTRRLPAPSLRSG